MRKRLKLVLMFTMFTALFFGFLHLFVPDRTLYNFERLHIFLFNLVSGGTILIHFTEGNPGLTTKGKVFFGLALAYALLAFWEFYLPAIVVAFILAAIVESVRIKKFSFFPVNFFHPRERVSQKFHQAALLCLSIGLIMSALVIINNEFLKLVTMRKLQLDTFFLGFSFPLSLISMSVIFAFMKGDFSRVILRLKNIGFWNVNLGVIIFFIFILFEMFVHQVFVTTILFLCHSYILPFSKTRPSSPAEKFFNVGYVFPVVHSRHRHRLYYPGVFPLIRSRKPEIPAEDAHLCIALRLEPVRVGGHLPAR